MNSHVYMCQGVPSQESEQSCIYYVSGGTKPGKYGIFCFSIRFWNGFDNVVFFVFLLDFGIVLIVWYFLFFY